MKIEQINNFRKFLEKYKVFRELPEQYKSTKFCKLYYKMYEYILSIPKEKIIISHIVKRNEYINYMFSYINCFLEAKDFYNWKDRIYSLVTEKINSTDYRKFELLYNSKAKEFFDKIQEKRKATNLERYGKENYFQTEECKEKSKATCIKNHGVEYPAQSKEVQDKRKATCLERYGKEYILQTEECKEKSKATMLEIYGVEHPLQSKEIQEKHKATCMKNLSVEYPMQSKEIQEKSKATCMKNHGVEYPGQSKEVQNKKKSTCLKIYGKESYSQTEEFKEKTNNTWKNKTEEEIESIVEKHKATCMKNHGVEYPGQSKEVQDKRKATCLEIYGYENPAQSKEVQEKSKATCLERYGREHVGGWFDVSSHSNFGNEVCTAIDNLLGNPEDSIYYAKSGKEYCIHTDTKNYYIDMVIPSLGLAFEADGVYYHGLIEGQVDVKGTPVEEIWKGDQEKTIAIEKAGYKLFRIREDDWKSNKSKCLENLLKEIKNYVHSKENRI